MRLKRSARGQVLIYVLVMSVVIAVIAAALMRLVLMRVTVMDKAAGGGQGKLAAESGYQLLLDDWATNGTCHNPARVNGNPFCVSYSGGGPNTCGCSCSGTVAGNTINVTTSGTPDSCAITSTYVSP